MMIRVITTLLGCLLIVQGRESGKSFKTIPTITRSLVNLGKMDISFHFNSKDTPLKGDNLASPLFSFLSPKSDMALEESCACSGYRGFKDNFISQPSEILNKILMSNDLFSFNKEPLTSSLCCESHEHAQEDIVTFEFGPKNTMPMNTFSNLPKLPFIYKNIYPKRSQYGSASSMPISGKPKAIDIFLFPKKKDSLSFIPMKKDFIKKDGIQIVGDKELRNDFNNLKFRPSVPVNPGFQSSVKKDLTAQEKNETKKQTEKEEVEITTVAGSNSLK